MATSPEPRTGGRILVDALRIHGVDMAFCVPGESYLAVLDALYDARNAIRLITCRQEGGAANMAEAYGKLTGRPGVCLVTRGPGATNASIGVHTAMQDSTPMVLLIGQVARDARGREAFQEVDFRAMFSPLAKWAEEIDDPARIPEIVSRAFHVATSGRPGPVVLALPEDMLTETCAVADLGPYRPVQATPGAAEIATLREMLATAEHPFVLAGGGGWTVAACADFQAFAEANDLPVGVSFRCQDRFDNAHPNYAGDVGIGINPALAERIRQTDLLLVVGPRLGEITTGGYTLIEAPRPKQRLIHVHAGAEELNRVYQADLAINAGMPQIAAALRAMAPVEADGRAEWRRAARADYEANVEHPTMPGPVDLAKIVDHLQMTLPPDAIVANDAGNFAAWGNRFFKFRRFPSQLGPTSGAMGYGFPAAIAAKALHPERAVVALAGDGSFLMTGQEMATAVQNRLGVIVLVVNNGMYGTIRMHQERKYPGRVYGTELANPDFAEYARAFGAHGEVVETTADFAPAFERARLARGPALIEIRIDPEAITPRTTLAQIRASSLARAGVGD